MDAAPLCEPCTACSLHSLHVSFTFSVISLSVLRFCITAIRHYELNTTSGDWQQIGTQYTLPDSGALGYSLTVSLDGLSVLVGDPMGNSGAGEAALYMRTSTIISNASKRQFQLVTKIRVPNSTMLGMAVALNGDATQFAVGGQSNNTHSEAATHGIKAELKTEADAEV